MNWAHGILIGAVAIIVFWMGLQFVMESDLQIEARKCDGLCFVEFKTSIRNIGIEDHKIICNCKEKPDEH